jgi:hypothetical protein
MVTMANVSLDNFIELFSSRLFIETDERILTESVVFIAVMSHFYDINDELGLQEWLSPVGTRLNPSGGRCAKRAFSPIPLTFHFFLSRDSLCKELIRRQTCFIVP